jgi:hypothetical protein
MDVRFETLNGNSAGTDEWLTPPKLVKALGEFNLDPCFSSPRPWDTAKVHYGLPQDGLALPWNGFVWCNPPYGKATEAWLKRMSEYRHGLILIFARTETRMFRKYIWESARALLFIYGRLAFFHADGTPADSAGAPSCVVAYDDEGVDRLLKAENLGIGRVVFIK